MAAYFEFRLLWAIFDTLGLGSEFWVLMALALILMVLRSEMK